MKNSHIISVFCAILLSVSLHSGAIGQNTPQSLPGNVYYHNSVPSGIDNNAMVSSNIGTDTKASGKNSFAGGSYTEAKGPQSFAFGTSCKSTVDNAFSFGLNTLANKPQSFVIGDGCIVGDFTGGTNGFAGGLSAIANGNQAFSFGHKTSATGEQAFAIGNGSNSTGTNTFAGGRGCMAAGESSFSFGVSCTAEEWASVAMGYAAITKGICSFALGNNVQALQNDGFVIGAGHYQQPLVNTNKGIMMGVGSSLPTVFISEAYTDGSTGRVSIGYNGESPSAKLHIVANGTPNSGIPEDADIMLQPLQSEGNASILFRNSSTYISARNDSKLRLVSNNAPMIFSSEKYCFGSESTFLSSDSELTFTMSSPKRLALTGMDVMVNSSNDIELNADRLIALGNKVSINTNEIMDGFALAVNGGIISTEVYVMTVDHWHDYVLGKDYNLMSLSDLKKYVIDNNHLPDVPSEEEVISKGYDMAEMQGILLKKIEELTLYILQQEERISQLENELNR